MNESKLLAETLIEMGSMVDILRSELSGEKYYREEAEKKQKSLDELIAKKNIDINRLQLQINEWKEKYEALNKELLVTKEKLTKARKRKKL